eukprot:1250738-Prymnesium_polylepis.1
MSEEIAATFASLSVLTCDDDEPCCLVCGSTTRLRCKGCNVSFYCSSECQNNDWGRHRHDCKVLSVKRLAQLNGKSLFNLEEVQGPGFFFVST